jgi:hypothetical protein
MTFWSFAAGGMARCDPLERIEIGFELARIGPQRGVGGRRPAMDIPARFGSFHGRRRGSVPSATSVTPNPTMIVRITTMFQSMR